MGRRCPFFILAVLLLAVVGWPNHPASAADDWLPISPEELAMKDYPGAPGTHAVMLYREQHTDDVESFERHYRRIKILSEQGKQEANIEIPYIKRLVRPTDIKARVIRPDGSIVPFRGEIFDKVLVKARGVKLQAKTFSLPDVQVGSIIEYTYKLRWEPMIALTPEWEIQIKLPTRRARFSFKAHPQFTVAWSSRLPTGVSPKQEKGRVTSLEVSDVAAFQEEEYMPPEKQLKHIVQFYYFRRAPETPEKFWMQEGKDWNDIAENFIGKRGAIRQEASQLVDPSDDPETKLRKIYARVQQIRNLSYERDKTEKEEKREKLKDNNNVEDVLKRGYGYRNEINRLFIALARAAGLEAAVVRISERDVQFFNNRLLDGSQLDGEVSLVRVGAEERYFDPGTPHCPFGLLSWLRTGVQGIKLDKNGGTFVVTTQPNSVNAVIHRTGTLQLDETGTLKGKVRVSFIGQEAISRRLNTMDEDEVGRRKELTDEIKGWLPAGATVKLENVSGWEGFDVPLQAEVTLEVPGFAVPAGRRLLLPTNVFQAQEKHPFVTATRIHPVYLRNPFQEIDELTLEVPPGYAVDSVPAPRKSSPAFGSYQVNRAKAESKVQVERRLALEGFYFPVQYYSSLRSFFSTVRTADEEQVVLQRGAAGRRD
jgi:hypothetical protein